MEDLLMTKLISHYNLPAPTITNWFVETDDDYFEIEDTHGGEIKLHTKRGLGMAKFRNSDSLKITVINYDKFITSIQDEPFKSGRKRCDIIATEVNKYIIIGELKDRIHTRKVRSGAQKQILCSLQTLTNVPEIKSYIDLKTTKICCYFNKQSSSPTTINATTAFNRLPSMIPDGFKMSKPDIEAFGFEFYEYTGEQTMTLIS